MRCATDHQLLSVVSPEEGSTNAVCVLCMLFKAFLFMDETEVVFVLLVRRRQTTLETLSS